jgi:hypothetical protein
VQFQESLPTKDEQKKVEKKSIIYGGIWVIKA